MDQISQTNLDDVKQEKCSSNKISLETELSETLYNTMKDFVLSNPTWDQYKLINSALATFLVQNGCTDNSVSEIYLNQLFTPSKSFNTQTSSSTQGHHCKCGALPRRGWPACSIQYKHILTSP